MPSAAVVVGRQSMREAIDGRDLSLSFSKPNVFVRAAPSKDSAALEVLMRPITTSIAVADIKVNARNPRTHSKKQIGQIANSIVAFGFTAPVIIDEAAKLIAGHGRLEAAKQLGLKKIPAVVVQGLTEAKKRALLLADNKIAENAGWDRQRLAVEISELSELLVIEDLDLSLTGFEPVEVDQLAADFENENSDPADEIDAAAFSQAPVSRPGDLWLLGEHRLLCGDARHEGDVARLMGSESATMAFLDPPYNVRVKNIAGRGRTRHREFAMASGEMTRAEFTRFLEETLGHAARASASGAVHFVCMDWRHVRELAEAGEHVFGEMLNLITWVKSNAGQGSFYRSQHELIGVFRVGSGPHLNNVELGRHGRSRSNVWHYAGVNSFRAGRLADLQAHPTVKPVALVADAMKDCTRRGAIVLDTFAGAGTTVLAAERVGRRACALELDPRYVDVAIRRWQHHTRRDAQNAATGSTFDEAAVQGRSSQSSRRSGSRARGAQR